MALDERARHELFTTLEEVLGPVPAETLIGYLPPVGWADVATTHDLHQLEQRLTLRIDTLNERFDTLETRWDERFDTLNGRFDTLEARWNERIEALQARWDDRTEALEHRMASRMDQALAAQAQAMSRQTWAIASILLVALVGAIVTTAFL